MNTLSKNFWKCCLDYHTTMEFSQKELGALLAWSYVVCTSKC